MTQRVRRVVEMAACICVRGEKRGRKSTERNKPRRIGKPNVCGACPHCFLVQQKMFRRCTKRVHVLIAAGPEHHAVTIIGRGLSRSLSGLLRCCRAR